MKVHEENIKRYKNEESEDRDIIMKQNLYIECEYSCLLVSTVKMCPMSRTYFVSTDKVILVRECGHVFKREPFLDWAAGHSTCQRCTARIV